MKQSYLANKVKTNIAYGKPGFATNQYKSFDANHKFTILSKEKDIVNWQDEISIDVEGEIEKYTIYGVGYEKKVNDKTTYELNGSGIFNPKFRTNNVSIETFFNVYTKMTGKLCKNGNIKFTVNEDGESNKVSINGVIIEDNNTYSLICSFCARLI
jgi:hypothetical protein